MTGYVLIAVAIGLGSWLLLETTSGFGYDTKTGKIIQNGLLFVDSVPGGAKIHLNGKSQNADTSSRLILPAGDYSLALKKDGYRDWTRKFTLNEHSIARYVYPLLVPKEPKPRALKKYTPPPTLVTQTPDRRTLLVSVPRAAGAPYSFEQYDLGDIAKPPTAISLPASLLTNPAAASDKLTEVEWSTDNRHVLLRRDYPGGFEFLVLDRQDPASSVNLNRLFGANPTQVALRNKKVDQVYLFFAAGGEIRVGDTTNGQLAGAFIRNALAFKAHGTTLLTYVTNEGAPTGQVTGRIWDNGKNYDLNQFTAGSTYVLDAAQFQGHWYYVVASNTVDRVGIYKDPLNTLKSGSAETAQPSVALRLAGSEKVSFSSNARFIGLQGGDKLAVYDLENKESYSYGMAGASAVAIRWMDGHRWAGTIGGNLAIFDYDGINQQTLVPTTLPTGAFFDRDYERFFSVPAPDAAGASELQATDLRVGSDIPN